MSNSTAAAASPSHEHHFLLVEDSTHFAPLGAARSTLAEDGFDGCESARGMVIGAFAGLTTWIALAATARALWGWLAG